MISRYFITDNHYLDEYFITNAVADSCETWEETIEDALNTVNDLTEIEKPKIFKYTTCMKNGKLIIEIEQIFIDRKYVIGDQL